MTEFIESNINEEMIELIKGVCEKYVRQRGNRALLEKAQFFMVLQMRGIEYKIEIPKWITKTNKPVDKNRSNRISMTK